MPISMDELDQKIAKAIKSNPELRKVQLEARVNFAIADALAELLEFQSESESSIAAKVQIDSARMKSILCAAPGVDITMIELVMLATALNYQFFFQFVPRDPNAVPAFDDERSAIERVAAALEGRDRVTALWSVDGDQAS